MKPVFLLLLSFIISVNVVAQVSFTSVPLNKQIYPRNLSTNEGTVTISGTVNNIATPYDQMQVKKYRDGIYQTTYTAVLSYSGNIAGFTFSINITAELANYKMEVYGSQNGNLTLVSISDSLVSGDAYIIQGQSNAAAGYVSGSANTDNQNSFIRVYGSGSISGFTQVWYKANGDTWDGGGEGNCGQWGLRMSKDILDAHQIPIAIFNGANSGQPISWFIRNDANKFDQLTNYGRLLERITETGFTNNIRAIFWYQGESNSFAGNTTTTYKTSFNDLNSDWNEDYTGFEHLYIIQIKHGCGASKGNVNKIQEAHRELADEISNASIYATNGTNHSSDKCHYAYSDGYMLTGDHLFSLVNRDLYGAPDAPNIESPYVTSAAQTALNQITLTFKNAGDTYSWETGAEKDFKIGGSSIKVSTGTISSNTLILTLSGNLVSFTGLSFQGHVGKGSPSIRNANGLGIVGFKDFTITPFSPKFSDSISAESLFIYPNPAHENVLLDYELTQSGSVTVSVCDISGKKLLEKNIGEQEKGKQNIRLDISKLLPGIYEVIIGGADYVMRKKLIVE